MLTALQIRASVEGQILTATADPAGLVRILVVLDREYDAAAGVPPTLDDVLDMTSPDTFNYNDLQLEGAKRFKTLWDKVWVQPYAYTGPTYPSALKGITYHKYYKKMRQIILFNGTDNTAASGGKNAIWIFTMSDRGTTTPYETNIVAQCRVRFTNI